MSKLTRALVLGAMLVAMNLASLTTVALAQANDQPTNTRTPASRPPKARSARPGATPRWRPSSPPSPTTPPAPV